MRRAGRRVLTLALLTALGATALFAFMAPQS